MTYGGKALFELVVPGELFHYCQEDMAAGREGMTSRPGEEKKKSQTIRPQNPSSVTMLPPARLGFPEVLQPSQTAQLTGDQVFKHMILLQ